MNIVLYKNNKINVQAPTKHSASFSVTVILLIYMPLYFYYRLLTENVDNALIAAVPSIVSVLIMLYLLFKIHSIYKYFKASYLLLFLGMCFCMMVTVMFTNSGADSFVQLCTILLCVFLFSYQPLKAKEVSILFKLFVIGVILILLNTSDGSYIQPGKFNPNTGGFLLAMLFCVSFSIFMKRRNILYFVMALICLVLQIYFISRTGLLGCIAFLVLMLAFNAAQKTFDYKTIIYAFSILSILGVFIAYIYSEVLYPMIGNGVIVIFGKDLFTGRETIWHNAFQSIYENILFGVGNHLNEDLYNAGQTELVMNAHNQPLGILAAFGIVVFIIFYLLLAVFISILYRRNKNVISRAPAVFFAVIIIMSYFDIYFFSPYNLLAILIAYSLIIGTSRRKELKL